MPPSRADSSRTWFGPRAASRAADRAGFHRARLAEAVADAGPSAAARRRWHERWLRRAEGLGGEESELSISAVIPTYQDARLVGRAIDSVLAQRAGPVDVVVVDDGSTDETPAVLARYGGAIRVLSQPNRGLAAARNAGAALATGDLLHFLDADDALAPDAHAAWLEGFERQPQADLVYGSAHEVVEATGEVLAGRWAPTGRRGCPTRGFLRAVLRGYPFLPGVLALPRWRWLAAEPFDERLRQAEDDRWYLRLALAGAQVVGTPSLVLRRRLAEDRLSSTPGPMRRGWARSWLLGLIDLLAAPALWPLAALHLQTGAWPPRLEALESDPDGWLASLRQAVLERVTGAGGGRLCAGFSPRPLLAALVGFAEHVRPRSEGVPSCFAAPLAAAARGALRSAAPAGARDWAAWFGAQPSASAVRAARDELVQGCVRAQSGLPRGLAPLRAPLNGLPPARRAALRQRVRRAWWAAAAPRLLRRTIRRRLGSCWPPVLGASPRQSPEPPCRNQAGARAIRG